MSQSPLTDEIGRLVGDRYRLVAAVGTGPAGKVFVADDLRLQRRVALKLLTPALGEDRDFAKRFRRELQVASTLRHPHILVIHDWGDDDGGYVVTEYLEGGSLRSLLDRGVRLTPSQALAVGLSAARALEYAHGRRVVHRDVKPSNLLFADDGRLRIGDFGLARALADAAWTEPQGALLTSARYAAPEQALGQSLDGGADVYALALVLVEAVTGAVPFAADTTIGTLMARVDALMEVPDELGPLREVLERAGESDLGDRISAAELVNALMAVAEHLPPPAPLPLAPGQGSASDPTSEERDVEREDLHGGSLEDITIVGSIAMAEAGVRRARVVDPDWDDREPPLPDAVPVAPAGDGANVPTPAGSTSSVTPPVDSPVAVDGSSDELTGDDGRDDAEASGAAERRARNRLRWRRAWIALIVVVVLGGAVVGGLIYRANQVPVHTIPAVLSLGVDDATAQLEALGFDVTTTRTRKDGTRSGQLVAVRPETGSSLAEGETVTLVVSDGPTLVQLPTDLTGASAQSATARLTKAGLVVKEAQKAYSETEPDGTVIGYEKGTPAELEKGSPVVFVVSRGPEPRVVPSASGLTPEQFEAELTRLKLVPVREERYDLAVDTGGLIGVEPGAGTTLARGDQVKVIVSKGLLVEVPSLGGVVSVRGAIAKLEDAGLAPGEAKGSGKLSARPKGFDPPAGELVVEGSTVDIIME